MHTYVHQYKSYYQQRSAYSFIETCTDCYTHSSWSVHNAKLVHAVCIAEVDCYVLLCIILHPCVPLPCYVCVRISEYVYMVKIAGLLLATTTMLTNHCMQAIIVVRQCLFWIWQLLAHYLLIAGLELCYLEGQPKQLPG